MKRHILFVETSTPGTNGNATDPVVEFCDYLASQIDDYVYLVRPGAGAIRDTASGVRILPHQLKSLPLFHSLAIAVAVGEPSLLPLLHHRYPSSKICLWLPPGSAPTTLNFPQAEPIGQPLWSPGISSRRSSQSARRTGDVYRPGITPPQEFIIPDGGREAFSHAFRA